MIKVKFTNFMLISGLVLSLFALSESKLVYIFAQSEEQQTVAPEAQKKESVELAPPSPQPIPGPPSQLPQQVPSFPSETYETNEPVSSAQETTQAMGPEEAIEGVKLEKEKISLDLKGVDVVELFRILSKKMDKTIVPTKNVAGRINIFLNNLTFQDALDVILISQDLASETKGEIINIMTAAEYERLYGKKYNEKRKFKTIKLVYAKPASVFNVLGQIKSDIGKIIVDESSGVILLIDVPEKLKLMEDTVSTLDHPLETAILDLKYAKPADVKTQLTNAITTGPGELFVDERSAKVAISDLPEKMKKIKRLLKAFDEPTRQVFIEAEIIQITLKKEYQRGGISWEKLFGGNALDGLDFKGTFPISASYSPSPGLSAASLLMSIGTLSQNKYTAAIKFLQTYGDTKILSRPRITVVNNQEAKVMVGSREAYVSQTQSQSDVTTITAENVQFIDVGVKLNVVPNINKDGFITMKIRPEVSSVRETITTSLKSLIPVVETSEAETVVKVKDGTMIMIAGLMKDEKRKDSNGVPILARIPILGAIFGSVATQDKKTELIVFLTPHIVTGEEVIAGAEVEKLIPPEIMPEDMKELFTSKNVQKTEQAELKSTSEAVSKALSEAEKNSIYIQEKMKGIKKE